MKNKAYIIRVVTIDNLYEDYMVTAENLFYAKLKARKLFLKTYKNADTRLRFELIDTKNITSAVNIVKKEGK